MSKRIYLAGPYSDPSERVRQERFEALTLKAGELMRQGFLVYSPITSCHPIATTCDLPTGWDYWEEFDKSFIEWCDVFGLYMLKGWDKSVGVEAEVKLATCLMKPIWRMEVC